MFENFLDYGTSWMGHHNILYVGSHSKVVAARHTWGKSRKLKCVHQLMKASHPFNWSPHGMVRQKPALSRDNEATTSISGWVILT